LNLEETLYFTKLDIELNSFKNGNINEKQLLDINEKILSETFTCNQKGVRTGGKG